MFRLITPEIAAQIEQVMLRENRAGELWRQLPGGVHHHYRSTPGKRSVFSFEPVIATMRILHLYLP